MANGMFSGLFFVYIGVALLVIFILVFRAPLMARRVRKKIFSETWYEANEFYDNWPKSDLRANDCLGVFMLLSFDHPVTDGDYSKYKDVYVGKAAKAWKGAYAQLCNRGNRQIYKDFKNPKKYVYIQARFYHIEDIDKMERTLIGSLKADKSYNKEEIEAKKREEEGR